MLKNARDAQATSVLLPEPFCPVIAYNPFDVGSEISISPMDLMGP